MLLNTHKISIKVIKTSNRALTIDEVANTKRMKAVRKIRKVADKTLKIAVFFL